MATAHKLLTALGIAPDDVKSLRKFAAMADLTVEHLQYLDNEGVFPVGETLRAILRSTGLSELELKLRLGCLDTEVVEAISQRALEVAQQIETSISSKTPGTAEIPVREAFKTPLGTLYQGDCLTLLADMQDDSVDLIFADPPFNLNKLYPSKIDDNLKTERYLEWCEIWIRECARVLKPGGSFFMWNLPRWNSLLAGIAGRRLSFRHWIAVDIKYTLPIAGRLYPSHYSLVYFTKGRRPKTFRPDRLPMEVCPDCAFDLKDYGGYKDKMNPAGVSLTDVWHDIPPVRHAKYKRRKDANELSIKLLDRIVEMASAEGDMVFDPFGGGGTTYVVAELKGRRWLGIELGPVDDIVRRFAILDKESAVLEEARANLNILFPLEVRKHRVKRGLWTVDSERSRKAAQGEAGGTPMELDLR